MGPAGGRCRGGRHHRLRAGAARRCRLCRAARDRPRRSSRARRRRSSNRSRRRARSMPRSRARSSRSTTRLLGDPAKVNADAMGEGWFIKLRLADPKQLDGLMDEAAYQALCRGAALMRYLPLTDADRARHAGGDRRASIDALFADVPPAARHRGAARSAARDGRDRGRAPPRRDGGEEPQRRLGAVLSRRRRLSPPRPGGGRSPDPARRVPDLLHAVPARGVAGDTAISVRVPDPGRAADRHGGGERLAL